ncbi:hypothetical protein LOD99_546 [Oopsacas minuta]|uniref:Uncharacterized protein n=1 Tax=Oopsacas minuta TaxID=111878 RepID=A0AAV7KB11_9METZ|nr:hypothetical protein LOD99_546 [Oopsacas minuta]
MTFKPTSMIFFSKVKYMSIKLINVNLSFSSQDESSSREINLPSQLNSPLCVSRVDTDSRFLVKRTDQRNSGFGIMNKNGSHHPHRKKLKFLRPVLSMLKIPKPLAPASQLGFFDFPDSGVIDNKNGESISENTRTPFTGSKVSNIFSECYQSFVGLRQERTPLEQNRINREVVKTVCKLMKEIKLIRMEHNKCNRSKREIKCRRVDLSTDIDLQIPTRLSLQENREL